MITWSHSLLPCHAWLRLQEHWLLLPASIHQHLLSDTDHGWWWTWSTMSNNFEKHKCEIISRSTNIKYFWETKKSNNITEYFLETKSKYFLAILSRNDLTLLVEWSWAPWTRCCQVQAWLPVQSCSALSWSAWLCSAPSGQYEVLRAINNRSSSVIEYEIVWAGYYNQQQ